MDQQSYSCEFYIFNFFPKNFRLLVMYLELQSGFVHNGALVGILKIPTGLHSNLLNVINGPNC